MNKQLRKIDVIVSNAAANPSIDAILDSQESTLDKLWEINIKTAILLLQRNAIEEKTPLKRLGMLEDMAAATTFLASDEASYITGETIVVAGGMSSKTVILLLLKSLIKEPTGGRACHELVPVTMWTFRGKGCTPPPCALTAGDGFPHHNLCKVANVNTKRIGGDFVGDCRDATTKGRKTTLYRTLWDCWNAAQREEKEKFLTLRRIAWYKKEEASEKKTYVGCCNAT
ncbi:tropinone reductase-like protein 3 [Tanacetum coccineum]